MQIVSYWKDIKRIYRQDEFTIIRGIYQPNKYEAGIRCLGIHWDTYPQTYGILCPQVIPKELSLIILNGLKDIKSIPNQFSNSIIKESIEYLMHK